MKPRVFIGSSREGLPIANAIHANLTREAECTVWANGVFQLSMTTLTDLIRVLRDSDFGIFVFSPDDLAVMRGNIDLVVRDNVIFELGLFIGRLGPERCFFLIPDNATDLRLPSDLAGITPGYYEATRSDNNWTAALNPACMQVTQQMSRLKSFQDAQEATQSLSATLPSPVAPTAKPAATPKPKAAKAKPTAKNPRVTYEKYKRGILIKGDTKPHKEQIKELSGRWVGTLGGWIIPPGKVPAMLEAIPDAKEVEGSED